MATPEEQKSKLQSERLKQSQLEAERPLSTEEKLAKGFSNIERIQKSGAVSAQQSAATGRPLKDTSRRVNFEMMRTAASMRPRDMPTLAAAAISPVYRQNLAKRVASNQRRGQQEPGLANEQTRQQREEVKKVAKAAMRRGAIYVTDLLAAAFDLGSSGISFIIDIFIYMLTLGWLNLEMIYGKYFAKGKSRYVGPISWDPIPMPIDKDAIILQGFVVAADLAFGVAILVLSFGGFCLVHDYVKITNSLIEAALIGKELAQGGSGGLCFDGIITTAFGL